MPPPWTPPPWDPSHPPLISDAHVACCCGRGGRGRLGRACRGCSSSRRARSATGLPALNAPPPPCPADGSPRNSSQLGLLAHLPGRAALPPQRRGKPRASSRFPAGGVQKLVCALQTRPKSLNSPVYLIGSELWMKIVVECRLSSCKLHPGRCALGTSPAPRHTSAGPAGSRPRQAAATSAVRPLMEQCRGAPKGLRLLTAAWSHARGHVPAARSCAQQPMCTHRAHRPPPARAARQRNMGQHAGLRQAAGIRGAFGAVPRRHHAPRPCGPAAARRVERRRAERSCHAAPRHAAAPCMAHHCSATMAMSSMGLRQTDQGGG